DRIDLNRDGLFLRELERVMSEAVRVVIRVEKSVRRAACMCEQRIEHLMFNLTVAGDRPRISDKCRDLVALHSRGYIRDRRRSEGLGNGQRIAEFVDF